MKAQVGKTGLLIPKKFLHGIKSAEIRWENSHIVVEPTEIKNDPILGLGQKPGRSGRPSISREHDKHLYGKA